MQKTGSYRVLPGVQTTNITCKGWQLLPLVLICNDIYGLLSTFCQLFLGVRSSLPCPMPMHFHSFGAYINASPCALGASACECTGNLLPRIQTPSASAFIFISKRPCPHVCMQLPTPYTPPAYIQPVAYPTVAQDPGK